ncbi:hypothetical protein [Deminuibacter soli]|uniref:GLPGLI family protein n=1 Tax=Deminuibacter soli TaxID=2291815 RepID=A0A3E1NE51_9BACT|nr:hypothetical protein [Deminuibacter soli]RFM26132.1 hypothetical protein DXN05_21240 [Deminuibacter soli]
MFCASLVTGYAQAPKTVADCTVHFQVSVGDDGATDTRTTKTVYLRGRDVRIDMQSPEFTQTTLYNALRGSAVILREIGGQKYMSTLDADKWKKFNQKYDGMSVSLTSETKTILGYECKKAVATLKSGTVLNIFYAPAIVPSIAENDYQFKGIPGFVLEYETQGDKDKQKIRFVAVSMNLDPVPAVKFEVPKSGYRIL